LGIKIADFVPRPLIEQSVPRDTALLERRPFFLMGPFYTLFEDIAILDLDPNLPKRAVPVAGKAVLEEDGSNLAIVLSKIISQPKKKKKLAALLNRLLPFVKNVETEKLPDKSMLFTLLEKYFPKQRMPASLISDGTISAVGMIVALYFDERPIAVIEEPGRNIHPQLIARVVQMMVESSEKRQFIVTTHNPEFVKHAGVKRLVLVARDELGFTKAKRPASSQTVQRFLKRDLGVDELFSSHLLGA
jgi:predicted ATPase